MAPLDRAFALAQIDDIAMLIAEHLDFDMARLLNKFLDEHPIITETGQAFTLGRFETVAHILLIPGETHTFAAATSRRFHHDRIADLR